MPIYHLITNFSTAQTAPASDPTAPGTDLPLPPQRALRLCRNQRAGDLAGHGHRLDPEVSISTFPARYDKYSDVGPTFNPKYGLDWTIADGYQAARQLFDLLRGAAGRRARRSQPGRRVCQRCARSRRVHACRSRLSLGRSAFPVAPDLSPGNPAPRRGHQRARSDPPIWRRAIRREAADRQWLVDVGADLTPSFLPGLTPTSPCSTSNIKAA